MSSSASASPNCTHCGMFHPGSGTCPRIKAIDYFENGTIKRVEYHAPIPMGGQHVHLSADDIHTLSRTRA